jgi:hypothetical protein
VKRYTIFLILFALSLLASRLYLLSIIPATLTHDETVYAIQAYSYAVQGKTLNQDQPMWSIMPVDKMYAELPPLVLTPGFLIANNPLLASHLMPALLGIMFPILIGLFVYGIWKDKKLAIISVILSTFNPLLWQMSRLSYDAFFSAFFYFSGAVVILNCKNKLKLLSIPLFAFGFFQYQGFKLLLIPWVLLVIIMKFFSMYDKPFHELKERIKSRKLFKSLEFIAVAFSLVLTLFYVFILLPTQSSSSRLQQLIFTDKSYLSNSVDMDRKLAIPSPLISLASNKTTVVTDFIARRSIGSFDPKLLFLNLEPTANGFFVWTHGLFYWTEGIGMIVGIYLIIAVKRRLLGISVLTGVLLLNVPNLINTISEWYTLRGLLSYSLLLIIASIGLRKLWEMKHIRILVLMFYLINILGFTYQYFYRYPVISVDAGNIEERILARYIYLSQKKDHTTPIYIYGSEPHYLFYNYLLYSRSLNKKSADEIGKTVRENEGRHTKSYKYGNIVFTDNCTPNEKNGIAIRSVHFEMCEQEDTDPSPDQDSPDQLASKTNLAIVQVKDSGARYKIHGDSLCRDEKVTGFIQLRSFYQLRIENLSVSDFCSNWLAKLN